MLLPAERPLPPPRGMSSYLWRRQLVIMKYGAEGNPRDWSSALHTAAARGDTAVVRALVERERVPVDLRDRFGFTPIQVAYAHGAMAVVKYLTEKNERVAQGKDVVKESSDSEDSDDAEGAEDDSAEELAARAQRAQEEPQQGIDAQGLEDARVNDDSDNDDLVLLNGAVNDDSSDYSDASDASEDDDNDDSTGIDCSGQEQNGDDEEDDDDEDDEEEDVDDEDDDDEDDDEEEEDVDDAEQWHYEIVRDEDQEIVEGNNEVSMGNVPNRDDQVNKYEVISGDCDVGASTHAVVGEVAGTADQGSANTNDTNVDKTEMDEADMDSEHAKMKTDGKIGEGKLGEGTNVGEGSEKGSNAAASNGTEEGGDAKGVGGKGAGVNGEAGKDGLERGVLGGDKNSADEAEVANGKETQDETDIGPDSDRNMETDWQSHGGTDVDEKTEERKSLVNDLNKDNIDGQKQNDKAEVLNCVSVQGEMYEHSVLGKQVQKHELVESKEEKEFSPKHDQQDAFVLIEQSNGEENVNELALDKTNELKNLGENETGKQAQEYANEKSKQEQKKINGKEPVKVDVSEEQTGTDEMSAYEDKLIFMHKHGLIQVDKATEDFYSMCEMSQKSSNIMNDIALKYSNDVMGEKKQEVESNREQEQKEKKEGEEIKKTKDTAFVEEREKVEDEVDKYKMEARDERSKAEELKCALVEGEGCVDSSGGGQAPKEKLLEWEGNEVVEIGTQQENDSCENEMEEE